jgi:long-chain acyl-CoA synthetase
MSNQLMTAHAVMEAGGSYNLHANVQAVGGNLALPLLEQVVDKIIIDNKTQPVVIADYGSSQGKNSFAPLRTAIRALRRRVGSERPIVVAHVDQPANDFNTLFSALDRDPDRYTSDEPNIFPSAIGRSFYEQVFPADHVHLGWSAYAAMWLSRIPTFISGHFRGDRGTAAECEAFRQQATQDWEHFLSLRAKELRPGGRLLLVMVGMNEEGSTGSEALMDEANEVLANMVSEGVIRTEERARMVVGTSPRRMRDLLAPFGRDGQFQALTVESCQLQTLKDPTWAAFELDGNKEAMAIKRAKIFRATFAPSLACGLSDPTASGRFADLLEKALIERLTNKSVPFDTFVQTMVLAKRDGKLDDIEPKASDTGISQKKESALTLGAALHSRALANPGSTALCCGDGKMSFGELDQSSTRLAGWLLEQGLRPGDRVAIHCCNSIEGVQLFFAMFKAGLIAVPINFRLKAPEVAWILEHSQAAMCFSEAMLVPVAEQARSGSSSLPCVLTHLPELAGHQSPSFLPEVGSDRPAAILYTSGSTARPRGVTHTHRTLLAAAQLVADNLLESDDVVLVMTQMIHAAGLGGALLPAICRGAPAVLLPTFEPGAFLDTVERFRCPYTIGLPALLQSIVEEQGCRPRDTSSLRTVLASGDSVPPKLQQRFAQLLGVPLQEAIGMTETFPIALNPKHAIRPGSLGTAMPGIQIGIVDTDGRRLEDGEIGEMVVQSPVNCLGYWNDPAATHALLDDGWLHTGDLATRDAAGYLWFMGRQKEIIVHAGSNVSPQEVEEVLYQHPSIFEAGVVGVPDPACGERIVAFVSLRNGKAPGEQALREFVRKHLADYKVPGKIFFIHELPKGATGKVHRLALKAMLDERPR